MFADNCSLEDLEKWYKYDKQWGLVAVLFAPFRIDLEDLNTINF
jgi:hypothetical protein